MRFTKMEGIGNDYIYINGLEETGGRPGGAERADEPPSFRLRLRRTDPDPAQ